MLPALLFSGSFDAAEPARAHSGPPPARGIVYGVFFTEAPLAAYRGGVPGLEAPNPRSRGRQRLDPRSPSSRAYLAWLDDRQADHLEAMGRALRRPIDVIRHYRAAGNGVALRMTPREAALVSVLPGITHIVPDREVELATDRTVEMIGAFGVFDGSATGGVPNQGEGVIIGVIDTGVNFISPSFSDTPIDGHVYTNPLGPGVHVGWCDPANPNFDPKWACNEKLIGAWDFAEAFSSSENDGPEDNQGHGSHTSSTAAGNHVDMDGDGIADLSGVAPHANLIMYDACVSGCSSLALSASIDQAILDGVDVINYSISGGTNPWNPVNHDAFFLNAVAAGIFVAASAGNSGRAGTVNHLGPWLATVGASTHDRQNYTNELSSLHGGSHAPRNVEGLSRTPGYGPAPIVHAKNFDNGDPDPGLCESEFPAGTWSGEIVVCDRGDGSGIPRLMKGQNVLRGGAGGMVLANNLGGLLDVAEDLHTLPAIHIDALIGDDIRTWLDSGSGHTATITPSVKQFAFGAEDVMASFSSLGPNPLFDVVKPDLTNPGVSVFAAYSQAKFSNPTPYEGLAYSFLSGTSMSSPHTAGCAALLRSLHPGWTPSEVKSALMTTALTSVRKKDLVTPADPFDRGAGRVDLSRAGRAGILLDETEANYRAADPALGGDPRTLNLPSFSHSNCRGGCSWTRTLEGAAPSTVGWTVSGTGPSWMQFSFDPPAFSLAPGASQELEVRVSTQDPSTPFGDWQFGEVVLTPDDAAVPEARMPVAIVPLGSIRYDSSAVDDALGNANGAIDPGELFLLEVLLNNPQASPTTGFSGRLSSPTPGVTILDDEADWPAFPPQSAVASQAPHFLVLVDDSLPCGSEIQFELEVPPGVSGIPLSFDVALGAIPPPQSNTLSADTPLAIPDGSPQGVGSSIAVTDAFTIGDVSVTVAIAHADVGDLIVELKSPANTTVRLHNRSGDGTANLVTTYPSPTPPDGPGDLGDFTGESAQGTWTLNVSDRSNGVTGTLASWSLSLTGAPVTACSTIPCTPVAAASADPQAICEGEATLVSGAGSLEFGSGCSGTLEYRVESGGAPLQDWSPDPDVLVSPSTTTSYAVRVRDTGTLAEDMVLLDVDVFPVPAPVVIQSPSPQCLEAGALTLDAGPGFATYTWYDESRTQVLGFGRFLAGTCQANPIVELEVTNASGCSATTSFTKGCITCTPPEVSPPGSTVPLRILDTLGTMEFERLADPGLTYHLYNAGSLQELLAGDYRYKLCDLENGSSGTWTAVDATTARFTPADPGLFFEGYWIVVAEHPQGFVSPFGTGSDGTPRPPDADGEGSVATFGCP